MGVGSGSGVGVGSGVGEAVGGTVARGLPAGLGVGPVGVPVGPDVAGGGVTPGGRGVVRAWVPGGPGIGAVDARGSADGSPVSDVAAGNVSVGDGDTVTEGAGPTASTPLPGRLGPLTTANARTPTATTADAISAVPPVAARRRERRGGWARGWGGSDQLGRVRADGTGCSTGWGAGAGMSTMTRADDGAAASGAGVAAMPGIAGAGGETGAAIGADGAGATTFAIGSVNATQARQVPATWFQQFTHTERSHLGQDRIGDPPMSPNRSRSVPQCSQKSDDRSSLSVIVTRVDPDASRCDQP